MGTVDSPRVAWTCSMIGNIRNAWIRRGLLIVLAPFVVTLCEGVRLWTYLDREYGRDVRDTWEGPLRK